MSKVLRPEKMILGCQSIHYSLWCLTAFTLCLLCVPKHHASLLCQAVWQLNSLSSSQGTKRLEQIFVTRSRCLQLEWHLRNQSEISPLGMLMKGDVCVRRNMVLLICRDAFCHRLPSRPLGQMCFVDVHEEQQLLVYQCLFSANILSCRCMLRVLN